MKDFDIEDWMKAFTAALLAAFGDRLVFVGLQGSYARGEAGPGSDIDAVVIFSALDGAVLDAYEKLAGAQPRRELLCGFVSDEATLRAWDQADLFQFYYDTKPFFGRLDALLTPPTRADAARAAHTGACGLYHACCHNLLHEKSPDLLAELYKNVRFVLTACVFARTGQYVSRKEDLSAWLRPEERPLLEPAGTMDEAEFRRRSLQLLEHTGALVRELRP